MNKKKKFFSILESKKIEYLRHILLNHFYSYGYEIILTPIIDYNNFSLNKIFKKNKNQLYTIKLINHINKYFLNIRNNITKQISKINFYSKKNKIYRICYIGNILNNFYKQNNFYFSEALQIGLELFGTNNIKSDIEIQNIALYSLLKCKIYKIKLYLSNINIINSIIENDKNAIKDKKYLFYLFKNKDYYNLKKIIKNYSYKTKFSLLSLIKLYGNISILNEAKKKLPKTLKIIKALNDLKIIFNTINIKNIIFDLSDVDGYEYYNGIKFNIFTNKSITPIIKGGRYFQYNKQAVGFSINLYELCHLIKNIKKKKSFLILYNNKKKINKKIQKLRNIGNIITQNFLKNDNQNFELNFNKKIKLFNNKWIIKNI